MADDTTYPHLLSAVGFGQSAQQDAMGGMTGGATGSMESPGASGPTASATSTPGGTPAGSTDYGNYAQTAGFAGAQGAGQIEAIKRKLAAAKQTLALKGEEERLGINQKMEDRGFFNSGQRLTSLAKQAGMEASQQGELEAGAAEDIGNVEAQIAQAQVENQIKQEQRTQNQTMFNQQQAMYPIQQQLAQQQLQQQKEQFELQMKLMRQQLQNEQQAAKGNYGT